MSLSLKNQAQCLVVLCISCRLVQSKVESGCIKFYLVDRCMVTPPWVRLEGVRAEGIFGVGSLILIHVAFLPTTFLAFQGATGVVTLR
jgi:hypothetical protein